ncbi:MAG TPA: asparagine synthase (glutamine-hydrolyzing) [Candidatus Sulfotelmatobacter sp.]|nr:asparagine synthase (glutamine-hydrolyzing) [Candidatus Sulfotelmatobacter sp.]
MCGICGKFYFDKDSRVPAALLKDMTDAMVHRGPNDEGFYISGQVGFGFRRLSIIDLSGGHQPLSNEDGTVWIVFNGEIYNYQTLREDLLARGHVFKTKSDTEVIVHLYEEYGPDCVQRLRGMFGFAIWDSRQRSLFLARDRVGIKPLYYYVHDRFIVFGSEIKAILADKEIPREVAPELIDRFLSYQYMPGGQTLLRNLLKLEPGHTLLAKNGKFKVERYWDLEFSEPQHAQSQRDLEHNLISLLDETVQLHMISDVPVGFLLSGGLDSTAMLSLAAQKTDKEISTFTVGFSSEGVVDERPFAKLAANKFRSKHYELSISAADFAGFIPQYVWHMEEPVCEPPAVALYYVSKLASQHVKVLISGEGGDEAFAGYENYRNLFWFEKLKAMLGPLQPVTGRGISAVGKKLGSRVLTKYGSRMGVPFEEYYFSRTSSPFEYFPSRRRNLYSKTLRECVDPSMSVSVSRAYLSRAAEYSLLNKMLYVDTNTWLPDDLLIKADKMTMANSVELRVPLLDHKVLEFAAALPRNQKVRGRTMKYLAKKALKNHVPKEILDRRKAGFPVPYRTWFRTQLHDWTSDLLLESRTINRGYFDRTAIEELLNSSSNGADYAKELFSLVVLELWHRTFADQGTTAMPSQTSSQRKILSSLEVSQLSGVV